MQNSTDAYQTITKLNEGFYKEKGSKFLAYAMPCTSKEEAKAAIDKLWKDNHGACHICFAWRFGAEKFEDRFSDDGEPNNSAGKPIFGQILSFDLTNILIAVVRYYGGTNLGVGGLITAYKTAAKSALDQAKIKTKYISVYFSVSFDYEHTGIVMSTLNKLNAEISEQAFENNCPVIYFHTIRAKQKLVETSFKAFPALKLTYITTA